MFFSVLFALTAATAPPAAAPRVLVYDLRNDGADERAVRLVRETLTTELGKNAQIDVVSIDEMNRILQLEGDKESAGCDLASDSCRADVAQSLGARYVVFGNVGMLGDLHLINLTLLDSQRGQTLARRQLEVRALSDAPDGLRRVAAEFASALGAPATTPSPAGTAPGLVFWSGVGAGTAALASVGFLVVGVASDATVASKDAALTFKDKHDAETTRNISYGISVASGAIALGGTALAVVAGIE